MGHGDVLDVLLTLSLVLEHDVLLLLPRVPVVLLPANLITIVVLLVNILLIWIHILLSTSTQLPLKLLSNGRILTFNHLYLLNLLGALQFLPDFLLSLISLLEDSHSPRVLPGQNLAYLLFLFLPAIFFLLGLALVLLDNVEVGIIAIRGHHRDLPVWLGRSLLQERKVEINELLECPVVVVTLLTFNAGH